MTPSAALRAVGRACWALAVLASAGCSPGPGAGSEAPLAVARLPRLVPDHAGAVIPPNLAPPSFRVDEPGTRYRLTVRGGGGEAIRLEAGDGGFRIPIRPWRRLLAANAGGTVRVQAEVRGADGRWSAYQAVVDTVATEPLDRYLTYRLLKPLYSKYVSMGIYQRDLEGFSERTVLHNRSVGGACLNCHTFNNQRTDAVILHTRGAYGLTMLLHAGGRTVSVRTQTRLNAAPAAYPSWHPGGRLLAFSVNKLSMFYHTQGETRDVFDSASDVLVYDVASNTVSTTPALAEPEVLEVWPCWSADGRYLYFTRAPQRPPEEFRQVRYDLARIPYDAGTRTWGAVETVLAAQEVGGSISQPRVSPDGGYLAFTVAEYGHFPIYLASSDVYLLDLATGAWRRLPQNSERADTWPSFSSNSRWLCFSSKRRDGLFARPHFSYLDARGETHAPFILPQEDPRFYDSFVQTYNRPELTLEPVKTTPRELAQALRDSAHVLHAQADPGVVLAERSGGASEPYSAGRRP
ncbi:MAG: hypothetical protein AB1505_18500 [Candidatus Latescibacterota bacterium]